MTVDMRRTGAISAIKKFFSYGITWAILGLMLSAFALCLDHTVFAGKVNPQLGEPNALDFTISFTPAECIGLLGVILILIAIVIKVKKLPEEKNLKFN